MIPQDFFKTIEAYRGRKFYIGFSGGADSTALLLLFCHYADELELDINAVHFDHQLRMESREDAVWCRNFCHDRAVSFREIKLDVPKNTLNGESDEAAARRLRLAAWKEIAEPESLIALGHHCDDRTENIMLRLCRGSNVSGLTSLRAEQEIDGMTFVRPLLPWSKKDIMDYLRSVNIGFWREDHTNQDNHYKRNFFRNKILPEMYCELGFAEKGILRSIEVLEQDAKFVEVAAENEYRKIAGKQQLESKFLFNMHSALRVRVLRRWLSEQTGLDIVPERNLLERIEEEYEKNSGEAKLVPVRGGIAIKIRNGSITLDVHPVTVSGKNLLEWHWRESEQLRYGSSTIAVTKCDKGVEYELGGDVAYFAADQLPDILIVRSWLDGDRMVPFGKHTPVKLKKIFADNKISAEDKHRYPVVATPDGQIIWLAGVRCSNFAEVKKNTESVVKFTFRAK